MSAIALAALLAVAAPGAAAPTSEPLKAELLDWAKLPTASQVASIYPKAALRRDIEGSAAVVCHIGGLRALRDCRVVSETPDGLDFGESAIRIAELFKLKARQSDPRAVAGAEVLLKVKFSLPGH